MIVLLCFASAWICNFSFFFNLCVFDVLVSFFLFHQALFLLIVVREDFVYLCAFRNSAFRGAVYAVLLKI